MVERIRGEAVEELRKIVDAEIKNQEEILDKLFLLKLKKAEKNKGKFEFKEYISQENGIHYKQGVRKGLLFVMSKISDLKPNTFAEALKSVEEK